MSRGRPPASNGAERRRNQCPRGSRPWLITDAPLGLRIRQRNAPRTPPTSPYGGIYMGSFMRRLGFSALTLMISAGAATTAAADVTKTVAAANQPSGIVSFIFGGTVGESTL